jgi:hypothetical protein
MRCSTTTSGLTSHQTVNAPSTPWNTTVPSRVSANGTLTCFWRRKAMATAAITTMIRPRVVAA